MVSYREYTYSTADVYIYREKYTEVISMTAILYPVVSVVSNSEI